MIMGNLNIFMRDTIGKREKCTADMADEADLINLAWHFLLWGRTPKQ